jgi:vacuolar-type H+-ATPase subunit I/STV1
MASTLDKFCSLFKSIDFTINREPVKPKVTEKKLEEQALDKILVELNKALSRAKVEFNAAKKIHKQGKMNANELFEFEMRMIEIREQINKVKEDSKYSDDELGELDLES